MGASSINGNGDTTIRRNREFDPAPILHVLPEQRLASPDDTVRFLERLHGVLPDTDYGHLVPFTHVYLTLTQKVREDVEKDRLHNRDAAAQAIPNFCQRYVDPLHDYLTGSHDTVTRQWRRTLDPLVMRRAHPVIQFAGGMIAHIRDDLKKTVEELGAPPDYHLDYSGRVGDHISSTARDLSMDYLPVAALMRERVVAHVVRRIAEWREEAWDDGVRLLSAQGNPAEYARIAQTEVADGALTGWVYRHLGNPALSALQVFAPTPSGAPDHPEFERAA